MHEIPNAIVGRFQLFERLGKGGFGEVHRGYDPKLQREVAIKIVRPERADRARVLAEARTAAGLQHPNIVTIYEVDEADDTFFIVMELLHGQVLGRRIEGAPLALRLSWLQQLASALALAHSRGIVHRDVKPENVIVVDATSTIKLLDFGIAKRIEPVQRALPTAGMTAFDIPPTQYGHIKGTPRYLAPEILLGESVSFATDQWAWGVVAYLVLAGRHPSEVAGAPDGAAWAVTGDLVPLAQLATNAPPHVVATTMRALSKDRARAFRRWASCWQPFSAVRALAWATRGSRLPPVPGRRRHPPDAWGHVRIRRRRDAWRHVRIRRRRDAWRQMRSMSS